MSSSQSTGSGSSSQQPNIDYRAYDIVDRGTNSQGNHYQSREWTGSDGNTYSGYHYNNADGSWYNANGDGTQYYNTGQDSSRFTRADGSGWTQERQPFAAGEAPRLSKTQGSAKK